MMKPIKLYLETEDENKLRMKAAELGFSGRGWLSQFMRKVASSDLVFIDTNVEKLCHLFQLNQKEEK